MTAARQDQIIEYSIDGGATWHHGRTVASRFAADKAVMADQRGHTRAWVRDDHPAADHVATRVLNADDPRAEVNRPGGGKFYAVRQATSGKVIGSRLMSQAEASREVAWWAAEIGPARTVPDSPAMRHAVRTYEQATLRAALYPEPAAGAPA
jgi:GNAT superfamily N-acetyltransferase